MNSQIQAGARDRWLRGLVATTWILYCLTFIPFKAEYLIQWAFAFVAVIGAVAAALAVLGLRGWRMVTIGAAVVGLLVYVDYWIWITDMARASRPEMAPLAVGHVAEQGWLLFKHHLASGAIFAAFKVMYFELIMPALEVVLLAVLLLLRAPATSPPSSPAPA